MWILWALDARPGRQTMSFYWQTHFRCLKKWSYSFYCMEFIPEFDVCGSVRHSIIHIEKPTRCHSVSKFYFIFIWSSTFFGRHTAHHQEPKTALAASGFACVEGCRTCSCWTLSASSNYTSNNKLFVLQGRALETLTLRLLMSYIYIWSTYSWCF